MTTAEVVLIRRGLLVAVALVAVLLIYTYVSAGGVQDASNNATLLAQFNALNPGLADDSSDSDSSDDSAS